VLHTKLPFSPISLYISTSKAPQCKAVEYKLSSGIVLALQITRQGEKDESRKTVPKDRKIKPKSPLPAFVGTHILHPVKKGLERTQNKSHTIGTEPQRIATKS
jgi:hypothetical protein